MGQVNGVVIQPPDLVGNELRDENVAVARIRSERPRGSGIGDLLEWHRVGSAVAQHPDLAAAVIAENVSAIKL